MELLKKRLKSSTTRTRLASVYDIHSPNIPSQEWIISLLKKAYAEKIPAERLWNQTQIVVLKLAIGRNRSTG
ncbi:hypothetical protein OH492_08220 [Vibrio chagasii]|nr:hypothetical protein [Vibrio chagasii]